jgi:hypothetical protein
VTDEFALINHCLFKGLLVFFVLPGEVERPRFEKGLQLLQDRAHAPFDAAAVAAYWEGIQERIEGKARWDRIAPMVEPGGDAAQQRQAFLSQNNIDNIAQKRPYTVFSINEIKYLLEVFNPRNELNLSYPGAGQPVLALVMKEEKFGSIQNRLAENADFYAIVQGLAAIFEADPILGMSSGNLASLMRAFFEQNVSASTDPWSFLFPLTVTKLAKPVGDVALQRYFKKVEDWGDGRLLLQIGTGIDFSLNRAQTDAAKILGMVPVQDLNPDVIKNRKA